MFAVSLVTIQTGNGFTRSTTQIINNSSADIWVASDSLVHLELTILYKPNPTGARRATSRSANC